MADETQETTLAPEELERIGKIILALDRTVRSRRLYAANNPVLIKHQQDLMNEFNHYLSQKEDLSFVVEPYEFKVDQEVVYQNTHEQESFSFKLFNDGIRSISFKSGITTEEIADFVDALNSQMSGKESDSDSVTLFWEREFEHITYSVADSIIEEPTIDHKSTDEKMEELLDPNMTQYESTGDVAQEDVYDDLAYNDVKVTLNMGSVGKMFQERSVLTSDELEQIQTDISQSDRPERLILDFVDMLMAVLQEETEVADYIKALEAVGSVLDTNILQGNLHLARIIMEHIHQLPSRSIALKEKNPQAVAQTLKILWPKVRIDLFIQSINQGISASPEDVVFLVRSMGAAALPDLISLLPTVVSDHRRKEIGHGMASLCKAGDFEPFRPILSSRDPAMVRLGIFILSRIKSDKIVDLLPGLIKHPDPNVQRDAISVLQNHPSSKTFSILLKLLDDRSESSRMAALRTLALAKDKEVARHLMSVINSENFGKKSTQERRAYFYAVAKVAGDDFIPFLESILSAKRWFSKTEDETQYQLATYGLATIGTPRSRETLQKLSQSKNKVIKKLSENALRLLSTTQQKQETR